jgi:hypothetical protein
MCFRKESELSSPKDDASGDRWDFAVTIWAAPFDLLRLHGIDRFYAFTVLTVRQ